MAINRPIETFPQPKKMGPNVSNAKLKRLNLQLDTGNLILIYEYDGDVPDAHFKLPVADVPGLEPQINGMLTGVHNHIKAQL